MSIELFGADIGHATSETAEVSTEDKKRTANERWRRRSVFSLRGLAAARTKLPQEAEAAANSVAGNTYGSAPTASFKAVKKASKKLSKKAKKDKKQACRQLDAAMELASAAAAEHVAGRKRKRGDK